MVWAGYTTALPEKILGFPKLEPERELSSFLDHHFRRGRVEGGRVVSHDLGEKSRGGESRHCGRESEGGRKWMITESVPVLNPVMCGPYFPSGTVLIRLVCHDTGA